MQPWRMSASSTSSPRSLVSVASLFPCRTCQPAISYGLATSSSDFRAVNVAKKLDCSRSSGCARLDADAELRAQERIEQRNRGILRYPPRF
jgi:hypothetical protein